MASLYRLAGVEGRSTVPLHYLLVVVSASFLLGGCFPDPVDCDEEFFCQSGGHIGSVECTGNCVHDTPEDSGWPEGNSFGSEMPNPNRNENPDEHFAFVDCYDFEGAFLETVTCYGTVSAQADVGGVNCNDGGGADWDVCPY